MLNYIGMAVMDGLIIQNWPAEGLYPLAGKCS